MSKHMKLPSAALRGFYRITLAALLMPLAGHATLAAEISVIAGDRIEVEGRDIHLWGVRAPEADAMCHGNGQGEPCAKVSRRLLEALIGKDEVICIVKDGRPDKPVSAQCSVDGADLGHLMITSGWATDDRAESAGFYELLEQAARTERVGMWKYR
ncbi:thermonuclease family protein [Azospirillum sp. Vi22]|nr:thermonuclease family protein [Azospirillum baldaniorum]